MGKPRLYRKRFFPMETIELKDDMILYQDDAMLVTKWKVFRTKEQFSQGISCYFLEKGYKVSKFMNDVGELVYYYCDIIDTMYDPEENRYVFTDLLVDVIVEPTGFVKVVDLAELADVLEEGVITEDIVKKALRQLEALLHIIYSGNFAALTKYLEIEAAYHE